MSEQKMREEFLCWVSGRKLVTRNKASLRMNSDESQFLDYRINDLWLSWQASREALVIELTYPGGDYEYADIQVDGACKHYWAAKKAIEAAGVKVKP